MNPSSKSKTITTLFTVLAGLALLTGLIVSLGLFNYAANARTSLMSFQVLLGPLTNLLVPYVMSAASWLGGILLVFALLVSALLYACGRLLAGQLTLSERVAQLEARLSSAEGDRHAWVGS